MNRLALNSAAINGAAVGGKIVFLPSSSISIGLEMSERTLTLMSGVATMFVNSTGDIARLAIFGAQLTSFAVNNTGELSRIPSLGGTVSVSLDAAGALMLRGGLSGFDSLQTTLTGELTQGLQAAFSPTTIDMDTYVTGVLQQQISLAGMTDLVLDVSATTVGARGGLLGTIALDTLLTGNLTRGVLVTLAGTADAQLLVDGSLTRGAGIALSGMADIQMLLDGNLSRGVRVPMEGLTLLNLDATGALRQQFALAGTTDMALNFLPVTMFTSVFLQGTVSASLSLTGALANNAFGVDIVANSMTRPANDTNMVRTA